MCTNNCSAYWDHADHVLIKDAINLWCDGSPSCEEARTGALISAINRGEVAFRRRDGKDFEDSVDELHRRNNLLIERESFLKWAKKISADVEIASLEKNVALHPRAETTFLNIIGAMADLMLTKSPGGQPYSVFNSQAAIIDALQARYGKADGVSQRTMEQKFAEARKSLNGSL